MVENLLDDTINDAQPVDLTGNAAYAEQFRFHRALQFLAAGLLIALVISLGVVAWLSRRPPTVLVVRVDELGHAEAVHYNAFSYTPREGEIRARLNDWAIDRYRLLRDVAATNFKLNYDFLPVALANQLMPQDAAHLAKILAGNEPEQDVQIDGIRFTQINNQRQPDGAVAGGEAVIEMTKIVGTDRQPWTVTVRYEVDPVAAAKRGETDPQFQNLNPLGVIITWFHEDRAFR